MAISKFFSGRLSCSQAIALSLDEEIFTIEQSIKKTQENLDSAIERIAIFSKQSSEAMVKERTIRDNIRYRELCTRIESVKMNVDRIRRELGALDRTSVLAHLQKQEMRHSELMGERSGIFGELRQLQDQTTRLENELSGDYHSIESDYRDQFIKYNVQSKLKVCIITRKLGHLHRHRGP